MVLALISYSNGILSYVPCSEKLRVGTIIRNKTFFDPSNFGCASYLKTMPVGTFIHCLELKQFFGAQLLRSYGAYARVMSKTTNQVFVKLRSGIIRGFCP